MAEQMRPASPEQAPDPSQNYERADPGRETGMGRLANDKATPPPKTADKSEEAAHNMQDGTRQLNAQDAVSQRGGPAPEQPAETTHSAREDRVSQRGGPAPEQPEHSMHDEEPLGADQAPTDIHDPRQKRHPRTEGKGGTP